MTFTNKLISAQQANNSWLCVGLDPVMERLPETVLNEASPFLTFGRAIIEATADVASAYKPNLAFWLAEGPAGLDALRQLIAGVPQTIPIILDAKFNDIGNTAKAYARAAFETLGADAVTVNPYLGRDGVQPFLSDGEHGIFLLARTSNTTAPDLQDHLVKGHPLYEQVARLATQWDAELPGACGLVVGATYPEELARLRQIAPELPFLIPGIGSQGGNLEAAVTHGPTSVGTGPVINSSRGIIYASSGPDFAEAARAAAVELRDRINQIREEIL
ncbi:MAG: orotidine-5'-phosphate decarboxylase [Anaerolineae bacterium]|nr:orotidine-5'-phosphate decarboxylase [Anaerolineae bacterium]